MYKFTIYFFFLFGFISEILGQFTDDFSDGDFTNNPEWFGDVDRFSVEEEELRLTAPEEADESYLVTENTYFGEATWEFKVRMTFQPSGANFARIYLVSDASDLTQALNGYFVLLGDTPREVALYKLEGTATTKIIDGVDGRLASSQVNVRVRVDRDENGNWELFSDTLGGINYFKEGEVFDDTFLNTNFFGVQCIYTATRSDRFYFDDFYVGELIVDTEPPVLVEAEAVSNNELTVMFDEPIDEVSAEETANYFVDNGVGAPTNAERDATNFSLIRLSFDTPFDIGFQYTLTTENIEDVSGNSSGEQTTSFMYVEAQMPAFGDIIINEFIPRESPSVGLPERQFVEIYNRSDKFFHLDEWKLSDRTGTGTIQDAWLYPDSILLLVPTSALDQFSGAAINVTNWQSLNNTGDNIVLETNDSILVDKLAYTDDWYKDEDKKDGGWSIERINPELPCSGEDNWRASIHPDGGTPGKHNSVLDFSPDSIPPKLTEVLTLDENRLRFRFNEGMDLSSLEEASFFTTPELTIDERVFDEAFPREMVLVFQASMIPGEVYEFDLIDVADCSGNGNSFSGSFVLPQEPEGNEIIINEILHHNLTGGSDFVELYNRSDKFIDLKDWALGNHNNDTIASLRFVEVNYVLAPDDYVVITRDSAFQKANYPFSVPGKFIQLASLPSYNVDSSTVYVVYNNQVMDKVSYLRDWHFRLLQSTRGVSLERFDPDGPSNDKNNWHSASETFGFATPGRENSQLQTPNEGGTLNLSSKSFSPDGDGFEDVLLITYELSTPSMLGELTVYDDLGRKTRTLLNNHLMGSEGVVKWDGTREDGNKASIGPYIIQLEALNTETGDKVSVRKVVTLAGKL